MVSTPAHSPKARYHKFRHASPSTKKKTAAQKDPPGAGDKSLSMTDFNPISPIKTYQPPVSTIKREDRFAANNATHNHLGTHTSTGPITTTNHVSGNAISKGVSKALSKGNSKSKNKNNNNNHHHHSDISPPRSPFSKESLDPSNDWAPQTKPTERIAFPNSLPSTIESTSSRLTDSGGEEEYDDMSGDDRSDQSSQPNVYHLGKRRPAAQGVKKPSPRHRQKLNEWYQKHISLSPDPSHDGSDSRILSSGSATYDQTLETGTYNTYGDTLQSNTFGSDTLASHGMSENYESRRYRRKSRGGIRTTDTLESFLTHYDSDVRKELLQLQQDVPIFSILVVSMQMLILITQITLCGVADLDINPMVGPFPDAFSEWGSKNAYLMLKENEWWRLLSSSFLHVGILHLLANAFCQFWTISTFEMEWGSFRWVFIYLVSAVGSTAFSSAADPNDIAVGSSGALMGMYAAKLAQVMSHTCFDVDHESVERVIRMDQLSNVLCGLTIVSLLSCFTYIEWSGHLGGLIVGFFAGIVAFSGPILSCCTRFFWTLLGLLGLMGSMALMGYYLLEFVEPDDDIGNACEYFRNLYPEGYDCDCKWQ
jgi:membrane associated rhomboid family serine protease